MSLYAYFDLSLGNSGLGDTGFSNYVLANSPIVMIGEETSKMVGSALAISTGDSERTTGFAGVSDGLEQLRKNGRIISRLERRRTEMWLN